MANSRSRVTADARRPRIFFDIPDSQWDFWESCQNQAKHAHLLLRDWLKAQVQLAQSQRQQLAQQMRPWHQGLQHGRQQGFLMAQLDQAFGTGHPEQIDRPRLTEWQTAHPQDWNDVRLWISQQSWAAAFALWERTGQSP